MRLKTTGAAATIAALCFWAGAVGQSLPQGVEKKSIQCDNAQHSYYLYVPEPGKNARPMPVIVVMHGAGGSGLEQVLAWKSVAEESKIILIGPNINNSAADWDQLYDHPEWIRSAIDETGKAHPVDERRIYLWGYSAGGMFSFYLALMESRYFAAAGVHGGIIENAKYQMADFAVRKVPFAYYIGTRDQWWTVKQTRASKEALVSRGFSVHYVEMQGADHNFYAHSAEITSDAWKFMKQYSLDGEPLFEPLDLAKIKTALK
jgi:poly(3-hydroxybutyrate) depolymerase